MRLDLFLFLILFSFCSNVFANTTIFEVKKQGIHLSNSKLLQFDALKPMGSLKFKVRAPQAFIKPKDVQLIDGKHAIETFSIKDLYGISIQKELCRGLCAFELDLYIEQAAKLDEVLFMYSSESMNERDSPVVLDLNSLERRKWVKLQLWIPDYLPRRGNEPDFQISNPTKFRLDDKKSPLSLPARRAIQLVQDITKLKGIFLHSISLKASNLGQSNKNESNIIKSALQTFPSHFEEPITISILLLFFGLSLLTFIIQIKKKLSLKILLGFIMPILASVCFLASQGVYDIFQSIETSELYKVQQQLQKDASQINGLGTKIQNSFYQRLEHTIIPKIKLVIEDFRSKNISLSKNDHGKVNRKVKRHQLPKTSLNQFHLDQHLDLKLNQIVTPFKINLMLANDDTVFYSDDYYLDKGTRHLSTILQKYIQNELRPVPNKSGRKQIEAMRKIVFDAVNNTETFDFFINNPSIPTRLHKHMIEKKTTSNQLFWTYFVEKIDEKNVVWLLFGGIEKQAVQSNFESELLSFFKTNNHSFDHYYFLGDNLRGSISNTNQGNNSMREICSYAKINRSFSFFPKIEDKQLYFYTYHMYEPTNLYSFTLRKSGRQYLKTVQTYKNYIYYSLFFLFAIILSCSYFLSLLVVYPMISLSQGMLNIEQENLDLELSSLGKDQFNDVSTLLNKILVSLREKKHLSKFLSEMALKSLDEHDLKSERKVKYIMFCGIQNLKELEQKHGLKIVVHLIDLFLQEVQDIIVQHEGKIDKFTGKSSLSIFDISSSPDTIVAMLTNLKSTLTDFANTQKVSIKFGVGIARGFVVLGHVGATQRKDFTAIGSTVNKAARLEALANKSNDQTNVYFDQECFEFFQPIKSLHYEICESVTLKGYAQEQSVYELL